MRLLIRIPSALLVLGFICPSAFPQSAKLEDRLSSARALYYTPTTAGLESFACKVSVDWKDVLGSASGGEIKDDNPFLQYLNSVHLAVNDRLNGNGSLEWSETAAPPQTLQDSATKLKQGIEQMLSGFFQSWNAYLNGTMVPFPDKSTTLTAQNSGVHLHAATGNTVLDEDYDQNMLLTKVHVVTGDADVNATPIFANTADGRLISEIHNEVRQPATAPPMYLDLSVQYGPVGKYTLPTKVHYEMKNVLRMDLNLSSCTVNSSGKPSSGTAH